VGDAILVYLNRLSDLFFAMARRANKERGVADTPWIPGA
jgi:cob(I)alamin adenosyltransferase